MADENLADLPEAIPLQRVSPLWRVAAILALCIVAMSFVGIFVLAIALASARAQANANWNGGALATPGAVPTTPFGADDDPPPVNPANLPYPSQDDLHWRNARQNAADAKQNSARDGFLRLGAEAWKSPQETYISELAVAPDGEQLAFFQGSNLVAGPFAGVRTVDFQTQPQFNRRWQRNPPPVPAQGAEHRLTGTPSWSRDSRRVYFACADGKLRSYTVATQEVEALPWRGDWPVAAANNQLIFFRSEPEPKLDAPGAPATSDPTAILIADLTTKVVRIVRQATPATLSHPAASPDGKRLAVWSTTKAASAWPKEYQLQLIDLADGSTKRLGEMTTNTPAPIAWRADGAALVYERDQEPPLPPDCLASDRRNYRYSTSGLFLLTIADAGEVRLSRGSGFGSPSLAQDGGLFFLAVTGGTGRVGSPRLRRTTLTAAQESAARTPEAPLRTAAAWGQLLQEVCKDAKVAPDATRAKLTPALMAQLAEKFNARYQEKFKEAPPADPDGFDRQVNETNALKLDPAARQRLALVLGAVRGEYLRTQHGAVWQLSEVPARRNGDERAPRPDDDPFVAVVDFIGLAENTDDPDDDDEDDDRFARAAAMLEWTIRNAEGRKLMLTNDPAGAKTAAAKLADPELKRGQDLLTNGKAAEAEKVFDALLRKPEHQNNDNLTLLVGRLLYEQKRLSAAEAIMQRACERGPNDARKYNLLGLTLLPNEPQRAVHAFKKALRCDLHHGPAWLNLADAYRHANDTPSAITCLKHFIETAGYTPLGTDASRRLAALEGN